MAFANALNHTQTPEEPASERFMTLATRVMLADLPPRASKKRNELNEIFRNRLLNLPGPKVTKPNDTRESRFVSALLWGNIEIQTTYFTISRARQYFRRSPGGDPNFKSDYLAFVVHAYLNEIYIFEQRMRAYLKTLSRAAAKGSEVRDGLEKIRPDMLKVVASAFEKVRGTRSTHVHEERFRDDGIGRLSSFELMNRFKRHFPSVDGLYRSELRLVRKSWDERFAANEIALKALMDLLL